MGDLTEARVHKMPACDFEGKDSEVCQGEEMFDFKTREGYWAHGCTLHYERHRLYSNLGLGKGQKLVSA